MTEADQKAAGSDRCLTKMALSAHSSCQEPPDYYSDGLCLNNRKRAYFSKPWAKSCVSALMALMTINLLAAVGSAQSKYTCVCDIAEESTAVSLSFS